MANAVFNNIHIGGIACAVPKRIKKTIEYTDNFSIGELNKFIDTTGVQEVHVANDVQTTSDLCFVAAQQLLEEKQIDKKSIDAIIFLSQLPDYLIPATSYVLHKRLELSKDCLAFDVNLGCSGYVYGLYLAATMLQSENINRILFLAGDVFFRQNPENQVTNEMLFGDAGSATIIESGNETIKSIFKSDGTGYPALIIPGGGARNPVKNLNNFYKDTVFQMDATAIFEFTITEIPKAFKEFFKIYETSIEEYDYCVFHQANLFILKHIAKKLKLPLEKMPVSIDRYGNTSSATIPVSIVDLCEREKVPNKMNLILSGFGIGLSWGVVSIEIESKNVLPMIFSDDYFKEAYRG
jgi:3-oxoacyl-[acyl-carrier-protein] synthase-3